MKRLLLIGISLMFSAGGWSGVLAGLVCPHAAAHQSYAAFEEHGAYCQKQVAKVEPHCTAASSDAMESMEMPSTAPATDERVYVLTSELINSCAHCSALSLPPTIRFLAGGNAAEHQKRIIKAAASPAHTLPAVFSPPLSPPRLMWPDTAPSISVRQHLLLGVFLI